jgi:hypothetical protein
MALPGMVQHTFSSLSYGGATAINGEFRFRLPNGSQAGNCLICAFGFGGNSNVMSISDDKGNTWVAGPKQNDAGNIQNVATFYALNVAAGTRLIKVKNVGTGDANYLSGSVSEFYNVATVSANDGPRRRQQRDGHGDHDGQFSRRARRAISCSPSCSTSRRRRRRSRRGRKPTSPGSSSTPTCRMAVRRSGACTTRRSAINPAMTMTPSHAWIGVTIALKNATAGAPRPAGIQVAAIHHFSLPSVGTAMPGVLAIDNPMVLQVPTVGNLLVAAYSTGETGFDLTSLTDTSGYAWEQAGNGRTHNLIYETIRIFYSQNRLIPSPLHVVTMNFNAINVSDATVLFYDVCGADANQHDVEQTAGADGRQTVAAATIDGPSITPVTDAGLVIALIQQEWNTEIAVSPAGLLFDSNEYDGMNVDGPQNMDQNGGWAHYYNPNTSPVTFTWAMKDPSGDPMFEWAAYAACFKRAPLAPTTAAIFHYPGQA